MNHKNSLFIHEIVIGSVLTLSILNYFLISTWNTLLLNYNLLLSLKKSTYYSMLSYLRLCPGRRSPTEDTLLLTTLTSAKVILALKGANGGGAGGAVNGQSKIWKMQKSFDPTSNFFITTFTARMINNFNCSGVC